MFAECTQINKFLNVQEITDLLKVDDKFPRKNTGKLCVNSLKRRN